MSQQERQTQQTSQVIARAAGKDKFFDVQNNLVPAKPEHYAMMHGAGGKQYAQNSTLRLTVTDYSNGKGDKSVTVNANVRPEVMSMLYEVCKLNFGGGGSRESQRMSDTIAEQALEALKVARNAVRDTASEDGEYYRVPVDQMKSLGSIIAQLNKDIRERFSVANSTTVSSGADYVYEQTKVNPYAIDDNGLAPVSTLHITRQGLRQNGEVSRYPWQIKVQNFKAKRVERAGGTINYDSKTIVDNKVAFIQISDDEMYRICCRVDHFVTMWENAVCIPMVAAAQGMRQQREER